MDAAAEFVYAHVIVEGRVQGVAYRAFTRDAARCLKLAGGVRNLADGRVEIEVEGVQREIEALLVQLRSGPPLARVDHVCVEWRVATGRYRDFLVWY